MNIVDPDHYYTASSSSQNIEVTVTNIDLSVRTPFREVVSNSGSKYSRVAYQYGDMGYLDVVPYTLKAVDGEEFIILDFTKHRHANLGYVKVQKHTREEESEE